MTSFANSNGTNIYFEVVGKGAPLFLIMGFGADGSAWKLHLDTYAKHFACYVIDNRGVGKSDQPKGPYTSQMMAEDVICVMDHCQIESASIVGISMGGAIAQEVALNHPHRVRKLILVSTWPRFNKYTQTVYQNLKKLRKTSKPEDFMELLQLWIFAPPYYQNQQAALLEGQRNSKNNLEPQSENGFNGQLDACIGHNTSARLHQIQAPTLITVGQQDIFTPVGYSKELYKEIPGSILEIFPETGHVHHWEALTKFNTITTEFLQKN